MTVRPRSGRRRLSGRVARVVLSLSVIVAAFAFALPKVAGLSEVWPRVVAMSWPVALLLGLAALWNLASYALVLVAATPGLTYPQAMVVTQSSTAVANSMPGGGALGVGVTAAMYRSWGFGPSATSLAVVATGTWNSFIKLGLPLLALGLLLVQGDGGGNRLALSLAGLLTLAVAVGAVSLVVGRDSVAQRTGIAAQRCVSWLRRRVRRSPVTGWDEHASQLRTRALDLLRRCWLRLTLAMLVSQLSLFLVLLLALRGVGVSESQVGTIEVLAAFAFVRLLSVVPLTPGGVGVIELGLTGALIAGGGDRGRVVAAVLIFRALTYLAPILVGALSYVVWHRRTSWLVSPSAARPAERRIERFETPDDERSPRSPNGRPTRQGDDHRAGAVARA